MKRLRLFRCRNALFSEELNFLPNSIRVLDWPNCPLQSMPSKFRGDKLSILLMPGSSKFKSLTAMNFDDCQSITKFLDISRCPNLKKINLGDCKNLVEVHDSVGFLNKLDTLNLSGCNKLKRLPSRLQLRSLQLLNLDNCSSLQNFPEIECEMEHLQEVSLSGTAIEELSSIRYLTGLLSLCLNYCVNLKGLPSSIHQLRSLDYIGLDHCPNIISFGMEEEEEVHNGQPTPFVVSTSWENEACTSLERLPEISKKFHFPRLEFINLTRCFKVNVGNCMPNPAWNGDFEMIFPGNKISDWFSHCKETSNSHRRKFDIKWSPPYNLDDIIGISLCAIFEPVGTGSLEVCVGGKPEDMRPDYIRTYVRQFAEIDSDHVWLRYLTIKDIWRLQDVSVDKADDHLRIIFKNCIPDNSLIFKRCGVHILYKHHDEQNAKDHENVDVHLDAPIEDIGNLANPIDHGSQLSKRRRIDYDDDCNVIESDMYPQRHYDDDDDEDDHNIGSNLYIRIFMRAFRR
ncbi:probable disease resistance protein RPP1 isoform X2 [Carya illinoinensis]|uniref:probable disease resistance protein RPP1 isoform X2 n=1 Tax=Carya illinoinensis TaxID=32201 RepID=UPI001C720F89|nr:probable disease resistance protein RPP1 isoform X2 [Carya illinoinensis]